MDFNPLPVILRPIEGPDFNFRPAKNDLRTGLPGGGPGVKMQNFYKNMQLLLPEIGKTLEPSGL